MGKIKRPSGGINSYIVSFTDRKEGRKSVLVRIFGSKFEAINKVKGEDFSRTNVTARSIKSN